MIITNRSSHVCALVLVGTLTLSCVQINAFTLRDARELCKRHRFLVLAAISAPVIYLYTNKLIKKVIQDYNKRTTDNTQAAPSNNSQEYVEGFADAFIKATKLVGTIFKVLRATTCPDEGKAPGDQWLDDIAQMA